MSERISALILGAGLMGRWHCDAIRAVGASTVAVCDRDTEAANRLASGVGARFGSDLAELIAATRPDIVHVCTPLATHRELAEQALRAGCHALVEKPVADTLRDTRELLDVARAHQRRLFPVHQLAFQRWLPRVESVGELLRLEYCTCSAGGFGQAPDRLDAAAREILPHPLSLFETLQSGCLSRARWSSLRARPGELAAQSRIDELLLNLAISLKGRPTRHELVVTGTRGTLHCDLFHGFALLEGEHASRAYKIVRPLAVHARGGALAATNLVRRALAREFAYPGLRSLVSAVHGELLGRGTTPLQPEHVEAVARARENILRELPSASSGGAPP